ncbi:MAG: virulence protein RhuM/Fic/DOC family protein [Candidatus Pacebacteria bacterium]|nr:virulence protein RhuM/Fic/DOC family protein [Candidatus Paceibacterota bacterium]
MTKDKFKKGEIIIYKTPQGPQLDVRLEQETVWLDAHKMVRIFNVERPAIVKHINNIYKTGELDKKSTRSILEQVAADGKVRQMNLYNLDMIISVGYRVNSQKATQFRIWATKTLKEHLVRGYTINEQRLLVAKDRFTELQNAISFLQEKTKHKLLVGQEQEILELLSGYSKTLVILEQYDKNELKIPVGKKATFVFNFSEARKVVKGLKQEVILSKRASNLFGQEYEGKFEAIIKNLYQAFSGKELYKTLGEKAANLLYLTIKDHPFVDGNKRIASFLFVYFLDKNKYLRRETGERKINDNALVALALLIAVSEPKDKDIIVKITTNLLDDFGK